MITALLIVMVILNIIVVFFELTNLFTTPRFNLGFSQI